MDVIRQRGVLAWAQGEAALADLQHIARDPVTDELHGEQWHALRALLDLTRERVL